MSTETLPLGSAPRSHPSLSRTFWVNARFAPRTSLGFMRLDFVLGTVFVLPFTQIVFFAYVAGLAGNPAISVAYVAVGNAVATMTYSSVFSVCQTTDMEKQQYTLEHLLVSPANRAALYLGRGLVPVLLSFLTVGVSLGYAVGIFGAAVAPGALLPVTISVLLTSVAMVGFGLLLGGVALYLRTSIILGNIFLFIGLLLSGANFPLSFLPVPLQWVGEALPLTWGIVAVRDSLSGAGWGPLLVAWAIVLGEGAASYALALGLWEVFERRAYRTGSLGRF